MKGKLLKLFGGLVFLLIANTLIAGPLDQWNWRFPYPQGRTLAGVTYGGGQFVAVGDNGTIIISPDGYHWTNQTSGVASYLRGVAYAGGEFAAVGDGGTILISSNAVNWIQLPAVTNSTLRSVAGNPAWLTNALPQFVAVGDSGISIIGNNGTNWAIAATGVTDSLYAVTYTPAAPAFYAGGDSGRVLRYISSWTLPKNNPGTTNYFAAATYGNSTYVFGGSTQVYGGGYPMYTAPVFAATKSFVSPYQIVDLSDQADTVSGLAYGTNTFVAVGYSKFTLEFDYPGMLLTSLDGTNWITPAGAPPENSLFAVTYGNGLFVAVGDAGEITVSGDALNWTEISAHHRSTITAIACSSNLCIAAGIPLPRESFVLWDFTTIVSTNGRDWKISTTNLPPISDLTYGSDRFAGVSFQNIYTTTDGYNWQSEEYYSNSFRAICYAQNQFVAVGDAGTIFTSADGLNWNNQSLATIGSFYGVAYGNGRFIASGNVTATSPDGITWSLCPSNPPTTITRICYGNGVFVAAGSAGGFSLSGSILTSPDGTNWQVQFSTNLVSGLAYSGGNFLATVSTYLTAQIVKSSDGTNWVSAGYYVPLVDNGSFIIYYGSSLNQLFPEYGMLEFFYAPVASYQGTFLVGGLDGILIQSGNTWNPTSLNPPQSSAGSFSFSYNEQIDVPYRIQTSTNCIHWQTVGSGIGSGQMTNFVYSASPGNPALFFRIVSP